MSERDELRGRLFMELLRYGRNTGHGTVETFECADRILALLPQQPKLEWRDNKLFVGHLCLGKIKYSSYVSEWGLYGHLGLSLGWRGTEAEARTAVEKAVLKALGWPK